MGFPVSGQNCFFFTFNKRIFNFDLPFLIELNPATKYLTVKILILESDKRSLKKN